MTADNDVVVGVDGVERFGAIMAFSLRQGGRSPAPFDTLNFSEDQGDSAENVRYNFEVLGKRLSLEPRQVVTCTQVHGDRLVVLDSVPESPPEADAIITTVAGIYPAVKVADCLPLLVVDPVRRVAAAVHAGWRGTVMRITTKVIQTMRSRFGCRSSDLMVGLGPAIGKCCYAVDDKVLTPFRNSFPEAERFISTQRSNGTGLEQSYLDLRAANRFELTMEGASETNLRSLDLCTSCRPDLLFSHRRDGAASGRHIALTGFRP